MCDIAFSVECVDRLVVGPAVLILLRSVLLALDPA